MNSSIEWVIVAFLTGVQPITFSLDYFFNPKFCFSGLLQFFFTEYFNNFFTFEITNKVCPWLIVFCFSLSWSQRLPYQFEAYIFAKVFLCFDILTGHQLWCSIFLLCSIPSISIYTFFDTHSYVYFSNSWSFHCILNTFIIYQQELSNYIVHSYTVRAKYRPIMEPCSNEFWSQIGSAIQRLLDYTSETTHLDNNIIFSFFSLAALHKKWSFPLRIFPVNVIKSAGNCGLGHIYWRNPWWKTSFFVQCWCSGFYFLYSFYTSSNIITSSYNFIQ